MATSYSVGKRYGNFIKDLVDSGRSPTASKVMREGLRLVEKREQLRGKTRSVASGRSGRSKQRSSHPVRSRPIDRVLDLSPRPEDQALGRQNQSPLTR